MAEPVQPALLALVSLFYILLRLTGAKFCRGRASTDIKAGLPKQQVTNRIALVHGVEQISHFGIFPDERALNVGQADLAKFDILDQGIQVVIHLFKNGFAHDLPLRLTSDYTDLDIIPL